jgi:hypothetical protein
MTGPITRGDIEGAIKGATGDPASGVVADVTPAIADAIDKLINGKPEGAADAKTKQDTRVVEAPEKR